MHSSSIYISIYHAPYAASSQVVEALQALDLCRNAMNTSTPPLDLSGPSEPVLMYSFAIQSHPRHELSFVLFVCLRDSFILRVSCHKPSDIHAEPRSVTQWPWTRYEVV